MTKHNRNQVYHENWKKCIDRSELCTGHCLSLSSLFIFKQVLLEIASIWTRCTTASSYPGYLISLDLATRGEAYLRGGAGGNLGGGNTQIKIIQKKKTLSMNITYVIQIIEGWQFNTPLQIRPALCRNSSICREPLTEPFLFLFFL